MSLSLTPIERERNQSPEGYTGEAMLSCTSSQGSVDLWDLKKMVGCPLLESQGTLGTVPSALMLCPGLGVLAVECGAAGVLQLHSAEAGRLRSGETWGRGETQPLSPRTTLPLSLSYFEVM